MIYEKSTKEEIEEILRTRFCPLELTVIDESHLHRNHVEAKAHPQAGHFKVILKSKEFEGLSLIKRHRLIYEALGPLMHSRIHALSMDLTY